MNADIFPSLRDIPPADQIDVLHQKEYLAGGELKKWDGETHEILSPVFIKEYDALKQVSLGSIPWMDANASLSVLDEAVKAYNNGRGQWPTLPVAKRIACVENFAVAFRQQREVIVKYLMWEIGKSRADAEKEFDRTDVYISDTMDALKELDHTSSRIQKHEGVFAQIRRGPLGIVLCMGPFNYPLNETFCTVIPALVMGNTIILKPPKYGVLLYHFLLPLFAEHFPPGVMNVVYGEGNVTAGTFMATGKIDVLAFIGTSRVANILKKEHPRPNRLRSVLALEAKNPAIILPDADMATAVKECLSGTLSFNGQRCTALKILFLHKKIADDFCSGFISGIRQMKMGMPWDKDVFITPLPEQNKTQILDEYVKDATTTGAQVINDNGGNYIESLYSPAVVANVKAGMRLYDEEQFGPVIPIVTYENIDAAISYITQSHYGQQVSIFGKDPDAIAGLIDPLVNQVCRVNINSQCQRGPDNYPFNGRKDSAEGTLSVTDALRVFSIRTMVAAKDQEMNREIISAILEERKSNFFSTEFIL